MVGDYEYEEGNIDRHGMLVGGKSCVGAGYEDVAPFHVEIV